MQRRGFLEYPDHRLKPEDFLGFTELSPFSQLWKRLGLTDDDLLLVQLGIMCEPDRWPVISDTGGVRKMRFVSKDGRHMRCCYKFYEHHHKVLLALAYPKNVKETLTADDKKRIRTAISEIDQEMNA